MTDLLKVLKMSQRSTGLCWPVIHLLIDSSHSFSKYLLSTYYVSVHPAPWPWQYRDYQDLLPSRS